MVASEVADVVRLKTPMHVPRVLSGTEVERLLAAIPKLKLRAMAATLGARDSAHSAHRSADAVVVRLVGVQLLGLC